MTVATTEATIATLLGNVSGVGEVHDRIRSATDRDLAEDYFIDDGTGEINCWEYQVDTETHHDGASGLIRTECVIEIVAHYAHDDANDSRGDFRDLLRTVSRALLATDGTGLISIKEPGVQLLEPPTLVKIRTGHSAYRARLGLRLWDDELT